MLLYLGLHETSDRKAAVTNDGHLWYTDTSLGTGIQNQLFFSEFIFLNG